MYGESDPDFARLLSETEVHEDNLDEDLIGSFFEQPVYKTAALIAMLFSVTVGASLFS